MGISEPFTVLPGLAIVQRLSTQFFDESNGTGLNSLLNSLVVVSIVGVSLLLILLVYFYFILLVVGCWLVVTSLNEKCCCYWQCH